MPADFDALANAHFQWKVKLRHYLHHGGDLHPERIMNDHSCELGCWIHGEGMRYASLPAWKSLKAEHASFHQAAANVVRMAQAGKKAEAEASLGANGVFNLASLRIGQALMEMKKKVA